MPLGADPWPALTAVFALVELVDDIDLDSVKRFKASVKDGFRSLRVESGEIRAVLPLTPEGAKRIATSAKAGLAQGYGRSSRRSICVQTTMGYPSCSVSKGH